MSELPAHSPVGASGYSRWSKCPGSVRKSKGLKDSPSIHAATGTVAHQIGEWCLENKKKQPADFIGTSYEQDGFTIEVDQEMIEAVQVYVDYVRGLNKRGSKLGVETKFHLKKLHPSLFGTNDACVYIPRTKTLHVIDYKHGQGVPVDVKGNGQLRYYAVGAAMDNNWQLDKIVMTIVQPRCAHPDGPIRSEEISLIDLAEWSYDLVDAVSATEDPSAPLVAGSHCRWCKAAGICEKLADESIELAKAEFSEDLPYDAEYLSSLLDKCEMVESWVKRVREFAYNEAEQGRTPPGYKLVNKRATRKFRDPDEVAPKLLDYGMDEKDIYAPSKLKTVAQLEKVVGKKEFAEHFSELVVSESSGHALVPASDARAPAKASAEDDFSGK